MENKYYLRIENNSFDILVEGLHQITKEDILITNDDYNKYIETISKGKNLIIKEKSTGSGLFDYIEEYTPEVVEEIPEPGIEEMVLDHEYRISKFELGV